MTETRTRWERKLIRRVRISDAIVVAIAVAVAHVVRYEVLPVSPEALLVRGPSFLQISLTVFVGWMIALAVFRTRDPKVLDSSTSQYQAVARATFTLFAWLAIMSLLLKWYPSRGFIPCRSPSD